MMFYIIYKTTNIINGKFYIGKHQTKDLNDGYIGSGKLLKRAIAKYGIENFHKEILYVFSTEKEMNLAEKILVVADPEISYNLCEGGKGGWGYINKIKTKEERSQQMKNCHIKHPNLAKNNLLKAHMSESIKKGVATKKEKYGNDYFKNLSPQGRGIPMSDEHKKRISIKIKEFWEKRKNTGVA